MSLSGHCVVAGEVYHLMTGRALPVVEDAGNAEVAEIVFPDFHLLLNAPWQKTGETIVSELLGRKRNLIH